RKEIASAVHLQFFKNPFEAGFVGQPGRKLPDWNPFLLSRISVADGNGIVFQRLVVDSYAKRRADKILPRIAFADGGSILIDYLKVHFKRLKNFPGFFRQAIL